MTHCQKCKPMRGSPECSGIGHDGHCGYCVIGDMDRGPCLGVNVPAVSFAVRDIGDGPDMVHAGGACVIVEFPKPERYGWRVKVVADSSVFGRGVWCDARDIGL